MLHQRRDLHGKCLFLGRAAALSLALSLGALPVFTASAYGDEPGSVISFQGSSSGSQQEVVQERPGDAASSNANGSASGNAGNAASANGVSASSSANASSSESPISSTIAESPGGTGSGSSSTSTSPSTGNGGNTASSGNSGSTASSGNSGSPASSGSSGSTVTSSTASASGSASTGSGSSSSSGSSGSQSSASQYSDAWTGYHNADGSDFTYLEMGTEVSKFQNENGAIDWYKAKAAGLDFVMIRLAYGLRMDAYYEENVEAAQAAGLKVGVYLCSTAKNLEQAEAEANLTVEKIRQYKLEYPVAFDAEVDSMLSEGADEATMTAMCNRYCDIVAAAGYTPIIYANKDWLQNHMNASELAYDVWYASYAKDKVYRPVEGTRTTIWQSSEKGKIDGIIGEITTEFSFKAYNGTETAGAQQGAAVSAVPSGENENASGSAAVTPTPTPAAPAAPGTAANAPAEGPSSAPSGDLEAGSPAGPSGSSGFRNGWEKDAASGLWYYYREGEMLTGWQQIDNAWYILRPDGSMGTGWQYVNGKWYFMGLDGAMRTGWKFINEVWYYLEESGEMLCNTTRTINGKSYSFDASGAWIP